MSLQRSMFGEQITLQIKYHDLVVSAIRKLQHSGRISPGEWGRRRLLLTTRLLWAFSAVRAPGYSHDASLRKVHKCPEQV